MHTNCKLLYQKYVLPLLTEGMRILEIGPDSFPSTYQSLSTSINVQWETLDVKYNPNLTYSNSPEYSFPIEGDTYDVVLSANVIEHVSRPWDWLPELARVTKPGGLVITMCPVSWIYHEAPIDCWRIYPEGMNNLYDHASLTPILSKWESLETPNFRRYLPGVSRENQGWKLRLTYSILGRIGFPVERSYDTVAVGRKR